MTNPLLRAEGVHKSFATATRQVEAVRGVDLEIAAGEWLAVMGPSGCGKSTLLHLLGGLDVPDEGTIVLDGISLGERSQTERAVLRRSRVGYVFQFYNLVPDLDAVENVEIAAQLAGVGATRGPSEGHRPDGRAGPGRAPRRRRHRAVRRRAAAGRPRPGAGQPARRCCWPTSPPAPSTPSRPARCSGSCAKPTTAARRS